MLFHNLSLKITSSNSMPLYYTLNLSQMLDFRFEPFPYFVLLFSTVRASMTDEVKQSRFWRLEKYNERNPRLSLLRSDNWRFWNHKAHMTFMKRIWFIKGIYFFLCATICALQWSERQKGQDHLAFKPSKWIKRLEWAKWTKWTKRMKYI